MADVSSSLSNLGYVKRRSGDLAGALAAYQESLDIARKLAAQDPDSVETQHDVMLSLNVIGDVNGRAGDPSGELAAYEESLDIARKLAAKDVDRRRVRTPIGVATSWLALLWQGQFSAPVHTQNHNPAIRRQQTAVEFGDDCLA